MAERTTDEKIQMCISFLQRHGYQVFIDRPGRGSAFTEKARKLASRKLLVDASSQCALVSASEIAELIGCTAQHVKNMAHDGRLAPPVISEHRFMRWRLADVQSYIASGAKA